MAGMDPDSDRTFVERLRAGFYSTMGDGDLF